MPRPADAPARRRESLRKGQTVWVVLADGLVYEARLVARARHLWRVEWSPPWSGESFMHPGRVFRNQADARNAART